MIGICPSVPPGSGMVSSIMSYINCQSQNLGSGAWQALAQPGSSLAILLTGFLTIFIALMGYNLLLGHTITLRAGTLAFAKIGVVLALATSWPAYHTLIYDVVTDGPLQLVAEIGTRAGFTGSDGTLLERLDLTDKALADLAILGPGVGAASEIDVPPPPFGGFDAFALSGARIVFLLTAIASLATVQVIISLTLALGPFFIAFLMFENTRSLFEGWLRVIGGAALAAFGVSITLGLQLGFLEPWLSEALASRMSGESLPTVSTDLFVIVCLFTIVVIAALLACARLTYAFRFAPLLKSMFPRLAQGGGDIKPAAPVNIGPAQHVEVERSRAAALASVLVATSRREQGVARSVASGTSSTAGGPLTGAGSRDVPRGFTPVGRSFTRRLSGRVSASSVRRDNRK